MNRKAFLEQFGNKLKDSLMDYFHSDDFLEDVRREYERGMSSSKSSRLSRNVDATMSSGGILSIHSYSKPDKSILKKYPYWQNPEYAWEYWNENGRIFDIVGWINDGMPNKNQKKPDKYFYSLDGDYFFEDLRYDMESYMESLIDDYMNYYIEDEFNF